MLRKCRRVAVSLSLVIFLISSISYTIRRFSDGKTSVTTIQHKRCRIMSPRRTSDTVNSDDEDSMFGQSLLLGKWPSRKSLFIFGYLLTENCTSSKHLEKSLESLILHLQHEQNHAFSIVVLVQDCPHVDLMFFQRRIREKFRKLLESTMLQVITTPNSFHVNVDGYSQYYESTTYKSQFIQSTREQVRNIAFLWKCAIARSDFFMQLTDRILVQGNLMSSLLDVTENWRENNWLWVDFKGFLTGRLYKTNDLPQFLELFDIAGQHFPANVILSYYATHFVFSRKLFRSPQPLSLVDERFDCNNPPAKITSSMILVEGGRHLQDIYTHREGRFWGAPKPGVDGFILIDFDKNVRLRHVRIGSGSYLFEDIFRSGYLAVVFGDENKKTECDSSKEIKMQEITGPVVEVNSRMLTKPVSCMRLILKDRSSVVTWLIIRYISIFT